MMKGTLIEAIPGFGKLGIAVTIEPAGDNEWNVTNAQDETIALDDMQLFDCVDCDAANDISGYDPFEDDEEYFDPDGYSDSDYASM